MKGDTYPAPRGGRVAQRFHHKGNVEDHTMLAVTTSIIAKGALDKATALVLAAIRGEFSRADIIVQDYDYRTRQKTVNTSEFPLPKPRKPRAKKGA